MNKRSIIVILALLFFFVTAMPTNAQDLTITCENDGELNVLPDPIGNLFDELVAPGESVEKTIEVENNDADDPCEVVLSIENLVQNVDVSSQYFVSIQVNNTDVFGTRIGGNATSNKIFTNLYNLSSLDLASIPVEQTSEISWIMTFDPSTGNDFQGESMMFNFVIDAKWGSASDGVEGGSVLGDDDVRKGKVLGATGEGIIIVSSVSLAVIILSFFLYKKLKKKDNR